MPRTRLTVERLEDRATPATFTWTGAGSDTNWSTTANWLGGTPTGNPLNTEDLVFPFPAIEGRTTSTNDLPGGNRTFNSITFRSSLNYVIGGNPIILGVPAVMDSGFVVVQSGAGANNILAMDIGLGASAGGVQTISVLAGAGLSVTGHISGSTGAGLTKDGTGTLTLANDNSGFTGTIRINNNGGRLVVTNANALGSATAETIGVDTGHLTLTQAIAEQGTGRSSSKVGASTLELLSTAASTYTGSTTIADGTLLLNMTTDEFGNGVGSTSRNPPVSPPPPC